MIRIEIDPIKWMLFIMCVFFLIYAKISEGYFGLIHMGIGLLAAIRIGTIIGNTIKKIAEILKNIIYDKRRKEN